LEAPRDYDALRPRFAWLPTDIIKKTFKVTTQFARMPLNTVLCKCFKSPNPAVNVRRHDELIATDTIQSNVPAINGGEKYAQIFVGTKSLVTDVHGMKSPAQFPGVLTDEIITRGAPTKLIIFHNENFECQHHGNISTKRFNSTTTGYVSSD
jgi:hypothetical protein